MRERRDLRAVLIEHHRNLPSGEHRALKQSWWHKAWAGRRREGAKTTALTP